VIVTFSLVHPANYEYNSALYKKNRKVYIILVLIFLDQLHLIENVFTLTSALNLNLTLTLTLILTLTLKRNYVFGLTK